jgi:hypothetical protein
MDEVWFQDRLVRFYFHITRKNTANDLFGLRTEIIHFLQMTQSSALVGSHYVDLFVSMILHTRNYSCYEMSSGKGEHDLTYMMFVLLYDVYPTIAETMIPLLFTKYGSWRDMKYICHYMYLLDKVKYDSIITLIVEYTNHVLKTDYETWKFSIYCGSRDHISSLYKWIPREHTQFGWLHERLAIHWAKTEKHYIFKTIKNPDSMYKAILKSKRIYRKVYATISKEIVGPVSVPSENYSGPIRDSFSIYAFMKRAYHGDINTDEANHIWAKYSATIPRDGFHHVLPMVDVSAKMQEYNSEPFYIALGLAILVAERSEKRILAYGATAEWIVLSQPNTIMTCIDEIKDAISAMDNMGSSLPSAFAWLQEQYTTANENLDEFKIRKQWRKLKLVIFSTYFPEEAVAQETDGPKRIYWNLSMSFTDSTIPVAYNQENRVLCSGTNGSLLSIFHTIKQCNKNSSFTPYSILQTVLGDRSLLTS